LPAESDPRSSGAPRTAVLLVNLGTPDAPTAEAVKRYLAEFLGDPRLIDFPRFVWLPLLHGVILNVRPAKTARAYRAIWFEDGNESPLRRHTRLQAATLSARSRVVTDWAMRYGSPSIKERIDALAASGIDQLLVVPLYPQYSATTTASVEDAVAAAVKDLSRPPDIRIARAFFDDPAYVGALATKARRDLERLAAPPERVLLSFHGLPQRYVDRGDPYAAQCAMTAKALRAAMGWDEDFAPLVYQSKFGPGRWLEPSTEKTLESLARSGVRTVAVMTPGFLADCIETLEEIAIRARETFLEAGGADLTALPCLNDGPEMIGLLEAIIRREMGAAAR
jgi:ferrochelatase